MADKILTALDKRIKSLESDVKSLDGTVKSLEADVKRLTLENKGLTAMVAKAPDQKAFMKAIAEQRSESGKLSRIFDMERKKTAEKQDKMDRKISEQNKEFARQGLVETRLKVLEGMVNGLAKR